MSVASALSSSGSGTLPGEEDAHSSSLSSAPPRLESVLKGVGSSRAFAIFLSEQATSETTRVGAGRVASVDVEFYHRVWTWSTSASSLAAASSSAAGAGPAYESALNANRVEARAIFMLFLHNPSLPSTSAPHARAFPPLHAPVSVEIHNAIGAQITSAESSRSSLPWTLFDPVSRAAYTYLNDHHFALFLNTLAFDHLEVESLLLGPEAEARRFWRSAHGCYKEEYAQFFSDYEVLRQTIEEGPPLDDAVEVSVSSRSGTTPPKSAALLWFEELVHSLDSMHLMYFRSRAEYALYIESDMRSTLVDSLKATKKSGVLSPILLSTLLTIKDYALEVLKYDVLPQYYADKRVDHRRQRRASLIAQDPAAATPATAQPLPVLQTPLLSMPAADPDDHISALNLNDRPPQRRASIINAAVDVSSGVRRASTIAAHRKARGSSDSGPSLPTPPSPPASSTSAVAGANIDGELRSKHRTDSEADAEEGGGPLPSSNPRLRSFSDLRARRSVIATSATASSSVAAQLALVATAAATAASPPNHSMDFFDDDEKQDSSPQASTHATTTQFREFSAVAEAMLKPAVAPSAASSASSDSSSPAPPAAFATLRRRSVLATAPHPPLPSATTPSSSRSRPEREVSFDLSASVSSAPRAGAVSVLPQSILKTKIRCETVAEALRRIFLERLGESDRYLAQLQAGALVQKFNAVGKAAERWFKVSQDGTELCWGKVDATSKQPLKASIFNRKKKFPFADCTRVRYGSSNSRRFAQYNLSAKSMPWMAFSVYFPGKTLDLVCQSEHEVDAWFRGVQALAPLNTTYLSKAQVAWRRAQMKIRYYAMWQNIEPIMFLEDLVSAARADVPLGRLPPTPVVSLLDEQIAATPEK